MRFLRVVLENWKNFRSVDLSLRRRVFIIGPNASGKSNLLDAFRFLQEIAHPEGGFQRAIKARDGVSQIRCLHARKQPHVAVGVSVLLDEQGWEYKLEFSQDRLRRAIVTKETVRRNGAVVLSRPDEADEKDPSRLSQTHLEQVSANKSFRAVAEFLAKVRYLHVVPQLIRETERVVVRAGDPYGSDFLEQIARTPKRTLEARLKRINEALRVAVPQLQKLELHRDERGVPHLKGLYEHWRPNAGWQTEEHFSDGTLRLLGLLWALLDGDAPLLLEEPELSLHAEVVRFVPSMMARAGRKEGRQVLVSTHSRDLLSDEGIAPQEIVMLEPTNDGTKAYLASVDPEIVAMQTAGLRVGDSALPRTAPRHAEQLALFGE